MVVLLGICETGYNAIKLDEKQRLFLSLQTVGYDVGDQGPGQGRAAAVCSSAERTLDAVEGQYAESWLLVRHFAPTAMMAGGGFLPTDISCSIKLREHQTIKKRGATHKLARLIYFMLTKGQPYVDVGQQYYEDRYRERVFQNLTKRAHTLGFQLIPVAVVV